MMNFNKKSLLLAVIATGFSCSKAVPARQSVQNKPAAMAKQQAPKAGDNISMEQMQQMQELEQFLQAFVVSLEITFFKKYPKFMSSLIGAYEKDASLVEQKVLTSVQRFIKEQGDQEMNTILKDAGAGKEAYAMIQQVKPFIENILVNEIVKWVHITATSGISFTSNVK